MQLCLRRVVKKEIRKKKKKGSGEMWKALENVRGYSK